MSFNFETLADADLKIKQLELELSEIRKQRNYIADDPIARSVEGQTAIFLHEKLCNHNHTDSCSWFYEKKNNIHNWNSDEHARWLLKAGQLLRLVDSTTIKAIVSIIKD